MGGLLTSFSRHALLCLALASCTSTTSAPITQTSTTSAPTTQTSTTSLPTSGTAPDGSTWHGVVVKTTGNATVDFLSLPTLAVEARVTLSDDHEALPGYCSTDLRATKDGILLGTSLEGGSSQAVRLEWSGTSVSDSFAVDSSAFQHLDKSGSVDSAWPVFVNRGGPNNNAELVVVQGDVNHAVEILSSERLFGSVISFDGRFVLVRIYPAEPACDYGAVFIVDLGQGTVLGCTPGGSADISGLPSTPDLEVLTLPPSATIDYAACREN